MKELKEILFWMQNWENAAKCINCCNYFFTAGFHLTENIFQQILFYCVLWWPVRTTLSYQFISALRVKLSSSLWHSSAHCSKNTGSLIGAGSVSVFFKYIFICFQIRSMAWDLFRWLLYKWWNHIYNSHKM